MFGKGEILKGQVGFELMTFRIAANIQTHCAMLLSNSYWGN